MTKKHKKTLIILCTIFILFCLTLYGIQYWVRHRLETELNQHNIPIHIEKITTGLNPFHFTLQNVTLKQIQPILLGNFYLKFSLLPPSVQIKSFTKNPLTADIKLYPDEIQIRQLSGQILQLTFQAAGTLNLKNESGLISIETKGLKTYIRKNFSDYFLLSTFLKDSTLSTKIHPKNGCLNMMNIPIWCYK